MVSLHAVRRDPFGSVRLNWRRVPIGEPSCARLLRKRSRAGRRAGCPTRSTVLRAGSERNLWKSAQSVDETMTMAISKRRLRKCFDQSVAVRTSRRDRLHFVLAWQASDELRWASNEGTLRAFRNADRFPTFKIFRRSGAL